MTESRSIDIAVEVPGTPEEVWDAIATGPGISSWFVPMTVDERAGGVVVMDFGSYGTETASVATWEPPHRVVFQSGGDRPLAYEWLVEARDGGTCTVRLVNSGFGVGEDWDGTYDGMTEGWGIFLQHLRLQLAHFRGRRATASQPTVTVPGPKAVAWTTICSALGVSETLSVGDLLRTAADGAPTLSAKVEATIATAKTTAYMLVVDQPAPGTGFVAAEGDGDTVMASLYLYLYGDDPATAGKEWASWVSTQFQAAGTDES